MDFSRSNSSAASWLPATVQFLLAGWVAFFATSGRAAPFTAPPPPVGTQAKLKATVSLAGIFQAREITDVAVLSGGSGYSAENPPTIKAVGLTGSGAEFRPLILGGSVVSVSVTSLGGNYSDDVTLVVEPPHTDDLKTLLENASIDEIELQQGVYYQNATITRDLILRGKGAGRTFISGGFLGSVITINGDVNVRLEDLTIIDGHETSGGGIYNDGGKLTLVRCEIKNCGAYGTGGQGGGIYNRGAARLTLIDSEIHHNAARFAGGGISNSGISESTLPAGSGSSQTAGAILQETFNSFRSITPPSSEGSQQDQFNSMLDTLGEIMSALAEVAGEIKPMFEELGFNLDVWEEGGMPTATIENSRLHDNKVGFGIQAAETSLTTTEPEILGYNVDNFGNKVPILGGLITAVTHPRDPRILGLGAGIYNDLGLVVISESTMTGNATETDLAAFGGAISSFFGVVQVTDSKLNGNKVFTTTVLPSGAAAYSYASWLRIFDSEMNDNEAPVGLFLSSGGAVKSTGLSFTELRRCEMSRNFSGGGGAVANDFLAILQVEDCQILNNSVTGIIGADGGGIRNNFGGQAFIENSTIAFNSAQGKAKGGGVFNQCQPWPVVSGAVGLIPPSTTTLVSSTISGNTVNGDSVYEIRGAPVLLLEALGGGLYNGSYQEGIALMNVISCTIADNVAKGGLIHTGGGLYNTPTSTIKVSLSGQVTIAPGYSPVEIVNNLFSNNTPNDLFNILPAVMVSLGYNMDSDGSGSGATFPSDDLLDSGARFVTEADAKMNPLRLNGGLTSTHSLRPDSPARDKGSPDDSVLSELFAPLEDQRGVTRSLGGRRDIGAFEATPPTGSPDDYGPSGEGLVILEDSSATVPAPGVLANDIGDTITSMLVAGPSHGTLLLAPDGGFSYTPAPNFTGDDSFTYRTVDAYDTTTGPITVSLTVVPRLDFISVSPAPDQPIGAAIQNFGLIFDESLNALEAAKHILLSGTMSGPIGFSVRYSTSDQGVVLTLLPNRDFQPNEIVTLNLLSSMRSRNLSPLYPAVTLRYRVGVDSGSGLLAAGPTFGSSTGSELLYLDFAPDSDQSDLDVVGSNPGDSVWFKSFFSPDLQYLPTGQSLSVPGEFGSQKAGSGLASADVNGDGFLDVVVVSNDLNDNNAVWLNTVNNPSAFVRDGDLSSRIKLPLATDVALGDLDNDGDPDLVILSDTTGFSFPGSRVYLNNGLGEFTPTGQPLSFLGQAVGLADFNGDGFLDMFIARNGEPDLVFLNDGTGRFHGNGQSLGDGASTAVALGDLNGDGHVDAVVAEGLRLRVWLNDGAGQFAAGANLGARADGVALGDMDADGDLDVVSSLLDSGFQNTPARNSLWFNDGSGNLSLGQTFGVGSASVTLGDADGDGDLDVLLPGAPNQVWLNSLQPVALAQNYTVVEDQTLSVDSASGLTAGAVGLNGSAWTAHLGVVEYRDKSLLGLWAQVGSNVPVITEWESGSWTFVYRTPSQPEHGVLTLLETGAFTYVPDPNFNGTDTFKYFLMDGMLATAEQTVTITIIPAPDAPTGRADIYPDLAFDSGTGIWSVSADAAKGVLANDTDPDGGSLTATLVSGPTFGTVNLNADGSFTFQSTPGFTGNGSFTYEVSNGGLSSGPVDVALGRLPMQLVDDFYTITPGQPLEVAAAEGVLVNDIDPNLALVPDAELVVVVFNTLRPSHGTLVIERDGSFKYTPDAGYTGADSFSYHALSLTAAGVAIQNSKTPGRVKLGNTAPIAVDDGPYTAFNGQPVTVPASEGLLANDSDPDGDTTLTASLVSGPANGSLSLSADGAFEYTPTGTFTGDDSFTYEMSDGLETSNVATVSLRSVTAMDIVALSPARHALNAAAGGNLTVSFSGALDASTVAGRVFVEGSQTGRRTFSSSVSGANLILDPAADFLPGEMVTVTVKGGLRSTGGAELDSTINWRFRVASPRGGRTGFVRTEPSATPHTGAHVSLGDLNGDGYPDAFVTNHKELPTVFMNNGDRTFTERQESLGLTSNCCSSLASVLADFNGDGRLDVLAKGYEFGSVAPRYRIGINNGAGAFPTTIELPTAGGFIPGHSEAGDFDGDGDVDLFGVDSGNAWIWRNDGSGNFTLDLNSVLTRPGSSLGGATGDVDNDGDLDVYVVGFQGDDLFLNDGAGLFTLTTAGLHTGRADGVELSDLNGDGFLDVVLASDNDAVVWFNDGTGQFVSGSQTLDAPGAGAVLDIALGDLDGDGALDLWQAAALGILGAGGDALWFGNGVGSFDFPGPLVGNSDSRGVALADLDKDGDLDAFVANGGSATPALAEAWFNEAPPRAVDDVYAANGTSPVVVIAAHGVLVNDIVGDGGAMQAVLDSQPFQGTITLNSDGSFTYTPNSGTSGPDVFTYHAQDSQGTSGSARVKIGNTSPLAAADSDFIAIADTLNSFAAPGVLGNDTDAEGDPLTAALATGVAHGTLELNSDGSFNYRPVSGYIGADSFQYQASDGVTLSAIVTVTLDVRAALGIVDVAPSPNAISIKDTTDFTIRFSNPLNASTVAANVMLNGEETGRRAFTFSVSGDTLVIQPTANLLAGEHLTLVLSEGLEGQNGARLLQPLVWPFIVEAPTGGGVFTDSGQRLGVEDRGNFQVRMGDMNGDGHLDAMVVKGAKIEGVHPNTTVVPGFAEVWINDGAGLFTANGEQMGVNPLRAELGDVDGDGDLDAILGDDTLWINNGSGMFSVAGQNFSVADTSDPIHKFADVDADGDLDILRLFRLPDLSYQMAVLMNDGAGNFSNNPGSVAGLAFGGLRVSSAAVGDVDGNGAVDIVVRPLFGNPTIVWLNDGAGNFQNSNLAFGQGAGSFISLADLDDDGDLDAFMPNAGSAFVWLNDGSGVFADNGQTYAAGGFIRDIQLGDIDGDGDLDAVVAENNPSLSGNQITLYVNDGLGQFVADANSFQLTHEASVKSGTAIGMGDVNGDSAVDLFIGGASTPAQVWFNQAGLAPLGELPSLTIPDKETATPFLDIPVRGTLSTSIQVTVTLDNPAKGGFILSSGFTGAVGGPYQLTATSAAAAETALRAFVFVPSQNRVPVGDQETTVLTVSVNDGNGTRSTTTPVTAVSVNDPPLAVDDSGTGFITGDSGAFTTANVLANDVDPDPGSALFVAGIITDLTLGAVTDLGNGTFEYDAGAQFEYLSVGETVTDSFDYVIEDGSGLQSQATVTITIEGENQLPVAVADQFGLLENAPETVITGALLTNDRDNDANDQLGLQIHSIDTSGTQGLVSLLAGDFITYQPRSLGANLAAGATAVDSFTYTVIDPSGGVSAPATVTVLLTGVGDAPIAGPDTLAITEDATVQDVTAVLKSNDSDPDPGQTASLVITGIDTSLTKGRATLSGGSVTYDPGSAFDYLPDGQTAADVFRYQVTDVDGLTSVADVTVTVTGLNDTPYAFNDLPGVEEGSGDTDLTSLLLTNDLDLDEGETETLTISAVDTTGTAGTVTFNSGTVLYRPDASLSLSRGEIVTDTFAYSVSDVHGATSTASVFVSIVGLNTTPLANPAQFVLLEDQSLSDAVSGSDADGDTLTFALATDVIHGTLVFNNDGTFVYTPENDYNGTDSFTFVVDDSDETSLPAVVSLEVQPVNDVPTFVGGPDQTLLEDAGLQSVSSWATAISSGPANEGGQTLAFELANDNPGLFSTPPAIAPDGTLTFAPSPQANGQARVTVVLKDDGGVDRNGVDTSAPQSFTITVRPVNDAPSFVLGADQTVDEDAGPQTVPNWATGISAGPADESGQTVSFALTQNNPSLFSAPPAVSPDGTLTYTPAPDANGTATVTVTLRDDGGTAEGGVEMSPPVSFTLTVRPVNDLPVINGQEFVSFNEGDLAVNLGTWSDVDGDTVTLTASIGGISDSGGGVWNWSFQTSDGPAESQDVEITADDGQGGVVLVQFSLEVLNVAPVVTIVGPASGFLASVESAILFEAVFTDPGLEGTHQAVWTFQNLDAAAETVAGTVTDRVVADELEFLSPGIYSVSLTVTDKDGDFGVANTVPLNEEFLPAFVVIYDPEGQFVTGGGWIWSLRGSMVWAPEVEGKATFGFNSKYKKGANVPTGQTQFRFDAGDLRFNSTSYQWLVVAGSRAQFKGEGTIDGLPDVFGFMVVGVDGDNNGKGDPDRFRIKIWHKTTGTVVYDNQMGIDDGSDLDDATILGGGSIVIH